MPLRIFKRLLQIFFFQTIFLILFVSPSLAADVYTLSKTLEAPDAGALYFSQCMNTGDFNNDGYQDLVVCGKPAGGGNVYIYYGSASGIGDSPDSTLTGVATLSSFGVSSMVDNLNNDNYDDLIILSAKYNGSYTHEGKIFVWYGQSENLSGSADFSYNGSATEEQFGAELEIADLTGDGYPELIVGSADGDDSYRGKVSIFLGEETLSGSPDYSLQGENTGDWFLDLASGKFNQDNYDDLIIGAQGFDSNRGKIYVYYGGSTFNTTADVEILGENTGDRFGDGVDAADFNNDGYDEAIVSARSYNSFKGRVYVYYGPNGIDSSADVKIDTNHALCFLGIGLGGLSTQVGEINNDNYYDLVLSCYSANDDTGEAYLHYGGSNHISSSPNLTFSGEATNSRFGGVIYSADLNNNGREDLVIGAFKYNSWQGRAYIYWGGRELNATEEQKFTAEVVGDTFPSYITDGDFNNDGYKELLLGFNNRDSNEGKAYLYELNHGSPSVNVDGFGYRNDSTPELTGTASDSGVNVGGVEYSVDSGSWADCSASDGSFNSGSETFSCILSASALSEGSHSVRVRSKDANSVYMLTSSYSTGSITVDETAPNSEWTNTSGAKRLYEGQLPADNLFTLNNLPAFTFTKTTDTISGLSKYQIIVNDQVYIDDILPDPPTEGNRKTRDERDRYSFYEGDTIFVYSKKREDQLADGAYKWKVRAVDRAGNCKDSEERILRINAHEAIFSGQYFPLSLLYLGGRNTNLTSLQPGNLPSSLIITDTTPTFYGITSTNSTVTLTLKQEGGEISTRSAVANPESRFGINITELLNLGSYTVLLSATSPAGDYAEIPEFKLTVGQSSPQPDVPGEATFQPTPISTPALTPTPSLQAPESKGLLERIIDQVKSVLSF